MCKVEKEVIMRAGKKVRTEGAKSGEVKIVNLNLFLTSFNIWIMNISYLKIV